MKPEQLQLLYDRPVPLTLAKRAVEKGRVLQLQTLSWGIMLDIEWEGVRFTFDHHHNQGWLLAMANIPGEFNRAYSHRLDIWFNMALDQIVRNWTDLYGWVTP